MCFILFADPCITRDHARRYWRNIENIEEDVGFIQTLRLGTLFPDKNAVAGSSSFIGC